MAQVPDIRVDEAAECLTLAGSTCPDSDMSPTCRKKLWMKTPFSSFSSDSTCCATELKNVGGLDLLRNELNSKGFVLDEDEKIQRWRNVVCSIEVSHRANRRSLEGPLRVVRLCILSIIIPGVLVGVPLYMRYFVYGEQVYPVGMSDMRLLDNRVSTTWCQSQTVWSNATFNAYLMSEQPQMEIGHEHVSMTRHLVLADDMKEYWGFYLLRGSIITVSTCCRYPGASLILIKGHKHLRDCAYIGDDSSEELDELDEDDGNYTQTHQDPANKPAKMTKLLPGIVHHRQINVSDKDSYAIHHRKRDHSTSESRSDKDNKVKKVLRTDHKNGQTVHLAFAEFGNNFGSYKRQFNIDMEKTKINPPKSGYKKVPKNNIQLEQEVSAEPTEKPKSSKEIYDDIVKKLEGLGDKGKSVLERLKAKMMNDGNNEIVTQNTAKINATFMPEKSSQTDIKIRHVNRKLNKKHKLRKNTTESEAEEELIRQKRELISSLHDRGEEEDNAMEEDIHQPDEIADIRGTINETTSFDKSNSEFWSSFSSSEERLLNCEGLLLNLPLMPHRECKQQQNEHKLNAASSVNKITYRVTSNGYYFFVFNSENEVQTNYLRVHFHLEKTKYDISKSVASCKNQTSACSLPLSFWSHQKVVLHLPIKKNDSLWNQEFLAISTCDPRTSVYMICVIAVPLFIMLFAFQ